MSAVGANAAVPADVVQQLRSMSGDGSYLARQIEQGGIKSYFGKIIHFASWDSDVAKLNRKVEAISSKIGEIEGEIDTINAKNAEWKKAHPVKSFLLTAGKVAACALYWAVMFTCFASVVGAPIFLLCEHKSKDVTTSSRIWYGNKLANKRGEIKKKTRERIRLESFVNYAPVDKARLNVIRGKVLAQLEGRLSTAPIAKQATIQATIDYLRDMNL